MAKFPGGSGGAVIGVVGVIVVGLAAWLQFGRDAEGPEPQITLSAVPDAAVPEQGAGPERDAVPDAPNVAPQDDTQAAVAEAAPAEPQQAPPPDPIAPAFDEVRREADGMTVIAGRAAPGGRVAVLLDGAEIAASTADLNGKFAAIVMIVADGQGHVLTLMQDGLVSADRIILAPQDAPVVVAEAEAEETPTEPVSPAMAATAPEPEPDATTDVATPDQQTDSAPSQTETSAEAMPAQQPQGSEPQADAQAQAVAQAQATKPQGIETAPESAPAAQEVAVLKTTEQGVELLNVTPPEVMDAVALDTISYSDQGEVRLSGRAQAAATAVRVYLDNNAVISLPVDEQGRWRGDLPDVDEGIYTLRVDEVAEDGSVTSRVETPFKRESPEVLNVAVAGQEGPLKKITVQRGATLWAIAEKRYGDGLLYVEVFKANRSDIRDPDLIYPGQVFDLPDN